MTFRIFPIHRIYFQDPITIIMQRPHHTSTLCIFLIIFVRSFVLYTSFCLCSLVCCMFFSTYIHDSGALSHHMDFFSRLLLHFTSSLLVSYFCFPLSFPTCFLVSRRFLPLAVSFVFLSKTYILRHLQVFSSIFTTSVPM